jgi:hypothetical protein
VVPVAFWVCNLNQGFKSVTGWGYPTSVYVLISGKDRLGAVYVNVVKVYNYDPRMIDEVLVVSSGELPGEQNDWKRLL